MAHAPAAACARSGRRAIEAAAPGARHLPPARRRRPAELLFCDNETNPPRLWNRLHRRGYCKDAFHERVVGGRAAAVNPARARHQGRAVVSLRGPARRHACSSACA